jgi:uncharacterized delta-60 repeat protein
VPEARGLAIWHLRPIGQAADDGGVHPPHTRRHPTGRDRRRRLPTRLVVLTVLASAALTARAWAIPGEADTSFSSDGFAVASFSRPLSSFADSVALQPNGQIVAAGVDVGGRSVAAFAVARFTPKGALDRAFGKHGKARTVFTAGPAVATDIALQEDGRILAGGFLGTPRGTGGPALARYLPDGRRDRAFGHDGRVFTDFAPRSAEIDALAIQSNGKILVVGGVAGSSLIVRYDAIGRIDRGFGRHGVIRTNVVPGAEGYRDVAIQTNGKVVAVGGSDHTNEFTAARYRRDGSLDPTFGATGIVTTSFPYSNTQATAVAIQSNGRLVLAGFTGVAYDAFVRYRRDGRPDVSFGADGIVQSDFGGLLFDAEMDSDGRITWVGGRHGDILLGRLLRDGSLDPTVGGGTGWVTAGPAKSLSRAFAMAIQPDGSVVIAGQAYNAERETSRFLVGRLLRS